MPLIDVRGFNLQPQAAPLTTGLQELAGFQALGQQNIQREREAQIRQLLGQAAQPQQPPTAQPDMAPQPVPTQQELITQARQIDPVLANQQLKAMGLDEPTKRAEASRFAAKLQSLPFEMRASAINARAQELQAKGRDPKDTIQLLDMTEEQQNQALTGFQLLDLSTKERLSLAGVGSKARLAQIKADIAQTKETFDRASKLRGEIAKSSSEFEKVNSAFGRIKASAVDPSPAGDLALIFNFMKVLDPGSTVREGEFANAQNAGGVGERVQSLYNNILEGTRLTPKQRADFVGRSKKLFTQAETMNKKNVDKFVNIGKQFGVSKENLLGAEQEQATPPPPPGFIIEGQ